MGSIESTVAYGPVYFNAQPNLQLSLTDSNILDALTLNVKTHGYNYAAGSELICLPEYNPTSSSSNIPNDKKVKDEFNYSAPYSLSEVHNKLSSKQTMIIRNTSFDANEKWNCFS
ncbi:hypothetical protein H5410_021074 [Solanum commersonii]|uniref:Uncharacterized protein n=1 Tax=Solanum commersonii TaxID=4109 RepID=A0A9J5ZAB1_SOLCO|nr:hypothetical protein H5410_021074 [Solanum commersonii]